ETALGAWHPSAAGIGFDGGAKGPGDCLELSLHDVVRVAAGQEPQVDRDAGVVRDALEHVPGQRPGVRGRGPPTADEDVGHALRLAVVHEVRTAGDVDHGL